MNGPLTALLLALAAWSVHAPSAPGADIVAFIVYFLFWPFVLLGLLLVVLANPAQLSDMDRPAVWRGPSALRWVMLATTIGCLLAINRPGLAGALWIAELLAAATRHLLRARLAPARGRA